MAYLLTECNPLCQAVGMTQLSHSTENRSASSVPTCDKCDQAASIFLNKGTDQEKRACAGHSHYAYATEDEIAAAERMALATIASHNRMPSRSHRKPDTCGQCGDAWVCIQRFHAGEQLITLGWTPHEVLALVYDEQMAA